MLVLVIWILLLVFIDVDSIQTVSIILIHFDVFPIFLSISSLRLAPAYPNFPSATAGL